MSLWRNKFKNVDQENPETAAPAPEVEAPKEAETPAPAAETPAPASPAPAAPEASSAEPAAEPTPVEPAAPPAEEPAVEPSEAPPATENPAPTETAAPAPTPEESAPAEPPALPSADLDFIQSVLDYRAAGCPTLKFEGHNVDFAYRVKLPSGWVYMPAEDLTKVKTEDLSVVRAGYYTSETGFRPLPDADSEYYKRLYLLGRNTAKKIW